MVYEDDNPAAVPPKSFFHHTLAVHMGYALPNCRDRKDDRGAEKIKWADPEEKRRFENKWSSMNNYNMELMKAKTARVELVRNIPCPSAGDAYELFYKTTYYHNTFAKDYRIGCRVQMFVPNDPAAEPVEELPAVSTPPKAGPAVATPPWPAAAPATPPRAAPASATPPEVSAASVLAAAEPVTSQPAWSTDYQVKEGGPHFRVPPEGTATSSGSVLPKPAAAVKSPPSRTRPEEAAPVASTSPVAGGTGPPERQTPDLPATTSTSSAAVQQQPDYYMPPRSKTPPPGPASTPLPKAKAPAAVKATAAAAATPAKARPAQRATSSASRAAVPANVLESSLGRTRVRFSPDVVFTNPQQANRNNSLEWFRLHNLELYSVGLEFLHQIKGLSPGMKACCEDLVGQPRPIWLLQGFGQHLVADFTAAAPESVEIFNVRTGFYDPEKDYTLTFHTGYYPENVESFTKAAGFKGWLEDCLDRIYCQSEASRLQAAGPEQAAVPGTIHCLHWCNKGTHRSVSACRVLAFAVGCLKFVGASPCCICYTCVFRLFALLFGFS